MNFHGQEDRREKERKKEKPGRKRKALSNYKNLNFDPVDDEHLVNTLTFVASSFFLSLSLSSLSLFLSKNFEIKREREKKKKETSSQRDQEEK